MVYSDYILTFLCTKEIGVCSINVPISTECNGSIVTLPKLNSIESLPKWSRSVGDILRNNTVSFDLSILAVLNEDEYDSVCFGVRDDILIESLSLSILSNTISCQFRLNLFLYNKKYRKIFISVKKYLETFLTNNNSRLLDKINVDLSTIKDSINIINDMLGPIHSELKSNKLPLNFESDDNISKHKINEYKERFNYND